MSVNALSRGPTVNTQVVLYNHSLSEVWRLFEGLSAAVTLAKDEGIISAGRLLLGDCSGLPALTDQDVEDLDSHSAANGLDSLVYEFFDHNIGHSGGQNRLANLGDSDFLLILNPDTYPAPTMLAELVSALEDPTIGLAEARQIPMEHPKEFEPFTGDTSWASACSVLTRRELFQSVGGFDEKNFPSYCNDVDMSWRVRLLGYRVVLVPTAVIFHDKQIAPSGHPLSTPTQPYDSSLGRLLLARRYDRGDILAETIALIESAGSEDQKRALEEFRRREGDGQLPESIPESAEVAQFVGGEYAVHRF